MACEQPIFEYSGSHHPMSSPTIGRDIRTLGDDSRGSHRPKGGGQRIEHTVGHFLRDTPVWITSMTMQGCPW